MGFDPILLLVYGIPILLAIPLHEAAHGWVAHKCGDNTAKNEGRVTFNPIKHVDPLGTIGLPLLLLITQAPFIFGWAKPVPVNFRNLRNLRRDMVLVAAAGPGINLVMALASAFALRYAMADYALGEVHEAPWWANMLVFSIMINITLAIFNMLPLLPLDGGRVLTGLLPPKLSASFSKTEKFGFPLLIAILLLPPALGEVLGQDWNLFRYILLPPILSVADMMFQLAGM